MVKPLNPSLDQAICEAELPTGYQLFAQTYLRLCVINCTFSPGTDSQQSYDNRHLFSAVAPLSGKSFHISSIDSFGSAGAHTFLLELKKEHLDTMVILVWDNAPCHRSKIHRTIPGLNLLADDIEGMKQLLGYGWIMEQCSVVS